MHTIRSACGHESYGRGPLFSGGAEGAPFFCAVFFPGVSFFLFFSEASLRRGCGGAAAAPRFFVHIFKLCSKLSKSAPSKKIFLKKREIYEGI